MTNELYHYGVLGMKWGQHKSGLSRVYLSNTRSAEKHYNKALKRAAKLDSTKHKTVLNPLYDIRKQRYERSKKKMKYKLDLAKASKTLIDTGDPIEVAFKKLDRTIDKGLDWCVANSDKVNTQLHAASLLNKSIGDDINRLSKKQQSLNNRTLNKLGLGG